MRYFIVSDRSQQDLQERVNRYIRRGWIPQGGVAFGNGNWSQAMFRSSPEPEAEHR